MRGMPRIWMLLILALAGCAVPATRGDDAALALAKERQAAELSQARNARLEAEVASIRAELAERQRHDLEFRSEQIKLAERIEHLLELQQRTYQAVTENSAGLIEYKELPALTQRQLELRAMVRTIDRLGLSQEQKQALIQMLHPPRQLDGNNPWSGTADWN
jgi:hypothetical protein